MESLSQVVACGKDFERTLEDYELSSGLHTVGEVLDSLPESIIESSADSDTSHRCYYADIDGNINNHITTFLNLTAEPALLPSTTENDKNQSPKCVPNSTTAQTDPTPLPPFDDFDTRDACNYCGCSINANHFTPFGVPRSSSLAGKTLSNPAQGYNGAPKMLKDSRTNCIKPTTQYRRAAAAAADNQKPVSSILRGSFDTSPSLLAVHSQPKANVRIPPKGDPVESATNVLPARRDSTGILDEIASLTIKPREHDNKTLAAWLNPETVPVTPNKMAKSLFSNDGSIPTATASGTFSTSGKGSKKEEPQKENHASPGLQHAKREQPQLSVRKDSDIDVEVSRDLCERITKILVERNAMWATFPEERSEEVGHTHEHTLPSETAGQVKGKEKSPVEVQQGLKRKQGQKNIHAQDTRKGQAVHFQIVPNVQKPLGQKQKQGSQESTAKGARKAAQWTIVAVPMPEQKLPASSLPAAACSKPSARNRKRRPSSRSETLEAEFLAGESAHGELLRMLEYPEVFQGASNRHFFKLSMMVFSPSNSFDPETWKREFDEIVEVAPSKKAFWSFYVLLSPTMIKDGRAHSMWASEEARNELACPPLSEREDELVPAFFVNDFVGWPLWRKQVDKELPGYWDALTARKLHRRTLQYLRLRLLLISSLLGSCRALTCTAEDLEWIEECFKRTFLTNQEVREYLVKLVMDKVGGPDARGAPDGGKCPFMRTVYKMQKALAKIHKRREAGAGGAMFAVESSAGEQATPSDGVAVD